MPGVSCQLAELREGALKSLSGSGGGIRFSKSMAGGFGPLAIGWAGPRYCYVRSGGKFVRGKLGNWREFEEPGDALGEFGGVACLAFPDGQDVVAQGAELAAGELVTMAVALELGEPVGVAGGGDAAAAASVHVPEAAVDVDDLVAGGEDEVWGAGEGADV